MKRFLVAAAAAAVAASAVVLPFVLGGGAAVPVDTGPLGGGPVDTSTCGPGGTVVIGMDELQNSTGAPIRVERFSLVGARGLELIGVDLVPLGDGPSIGVGSPYPPARSSLAGWDSRRALPTTMAPDHARWALVYGLRRTANTGTLSYPELLYEYRDVQYLWTSRVSVEVVSGSPSAAIRECSHLRDER